MATKRNPFKKYSRKKGPVTAKKVVYDGIQFLSGLEKTMYTALKTAGLFEKYEQESFILLEGFKFSSSVTERQANGKGDYKERGNNKLQSITYKPDFTGVDYIIECKGRANDSFPLRWKMFKKWLIDNNDTRYIYKPQTIKEVEETVKLILERKNK